MFTIIDGLKIEYTEAGTKDGIPVLLLHGWGSSFDVYKGIMNALSKKLPPYMIPAVVKKVDSLPQLPNGKLNRKILEEQENG